MIDKKRVAGIADLAMLDLDEEELEIFTEKLERTLEFFSRIAAFEASETDRGLYSSGLDGPLRDDAPAASHARSEMMANTDHEQDGFFRVGRVLE